MLPHTLLESWCIGRASAATHTAWSLGALGGSVLPHTLLESWCIGRASAATHTAWSLGALGGSVLPHTLHGVLVHWEGTHTAHWEGQCTEWSLGVCVLTHTPHSLSSHLVNTSISSRARCFPGQPAEMHRYMWVGLEYKLPSQ